MPEISRFYGIVIKMFFQDHAPPHFHAEYQENEAVFEIETLRIREGELPNKAKLLVVEWAMVHRDELFDAWSNAQKPEPIRKIAPLE